MNGCTACGKLLDEKKHSRENPHRKHHEVHQIPETASVVRAREATSRPEPAERERCEQTNQHEGR